MSRDALSFPAGIGLFRHLVGNGRGGRNTFIWELGGDDYEIILCLCCLCIFVFDE